MGISKSLNTAYGVPAAHWRITSVHIDITNQCVHVILEGRNVKTAQTPLLTKEYDIGMTLLPRANGLQKDITAYLLTTIAPAVTLDDGTVIPATPFCEFYQAPEEV
jgi:hypothetical protein